MVALGQVPEVSLAVLAIASSNQAFEVRYVAKQRFQASSLALGRRPYVLVIPA